MDEGCAVSDGYKTLFHHGDTEDTEKGKERKTIQVSDFG